jgi:imidazolonepropionase-like amidohydrolase
MSFQQILASLTTAPAAQFGDSGRFGRIASGFAGDLAIVAGDPSRNIRALANVRYTIRDGRIVFRER